MSIFSENLIAALMHIKQMRWWDENTFIIIVIMIFIIVHFYTGIKLTAARVSLKKM